MKLFKLLVFSSALSAVFANSQHEVEFDIDEPVSLEKQESVPLASEIGGESESFEGERIQEPKEPKEPKVANFVIEYNILENEGQLTSGAVEIESGNAITLAYNFTNNEDADVNVLAFGGILFDLQNGQKAGDIKKVDINPIFVAVNDSTLFNQKIPVTMPEGMYYLMPHIYVGKNGEEMQVGAPPTSVQVIPPALSIFNPQFLSIQLFFCVLVGLISYYGFGFKFGHTKKTGKRQSNKQSPTEWLPDTHKHK